MVCEKISAQREESNNQKIRGIRKRYMSSFSTSPTCHPLSPICASRNPFLLYHRRKTTPRLGPKAAKKKRSFRRHTIGIYGNSTKHQKIHTSVFYKRRRLEVPNPLSSLNGTLLLSKKKKNYHLLPYLPILFFTYIRKE